MDIQTRIELEHDADYPLSAEQAAAESIAALGGDPATDTCLATLVRRPETSQKWGTVVTAEIRLAAADDLLSDADECAALLLTALGDSAMDTCLTTLSMDRSTGQAGLPYPPVVA